MTHRLDDVTREVVDYRALALKLYSEATLTMPLDNSRYAPLRDALVSAFEAGASGKYEPSPDKFRYILKEKP